MNDIRKTRARALAAAVLALFWLASAGAAAQTLKLERLTDEQLGRLRKVALEQGSSIPVPPVLVGVLRLSPAQIAPTLRQVSFQGDDGVKHGFARLNDDTGYFFFRHSPVGLWAFHAEKDLKLTAGARNFSAKQFIALPAKEGQEEFAAEMNAWSRVLSPRGVSLPRPDAHMAPGAALPNAPMPGAALPGAAAPGSALPAPSTAKPAPVTAPSAPAR